MGTRVDLPKFSWRRGAILILALLITAAILIPPPSLSQNGQTQQPTGETQPWPSNDHPLSPRPGDDSRNDNDVRRSISARQKRSIMRATFERTKTDAAELAAIARQLREDLNKPNADFFSAGVSGRAERIEKLARKIREEAKGY